MIPFFDRFVDTREKRYHLLLFLVLLTVMVMAVSYLVLAFQLVTLENYDSLYSFLKRPYVEWTYLSRIIMDVISIVHFNVINVVACLIENLSVLEIIMSILLILACGILEQKRVTMICLILLAVEILACCGFALMGLNASSLQEVILYIRFIGMVMIVINVILLAILAYHGYRQLRCYVKALVFDVYEVKEHMDNQQDC